MVFFRNSKCRWTLNHAMPVRIKGLDAWQCAKWGKVQYIEHEVDSNEPIFDAHCSTPFHMFGKVPAPDEPIPGKRAQLVRCPPRCQSIPLQTNLIGCQVYDARSSVCSAAVQMGVLGVDQGGVIKVVGRSPPVSQG